MLREANLISDKDLENTHERNIFVERMKDVIRRAQNPIKILAKKILVTDSTLIMNEATKALNRDMAEVIVLAADASPLEIILHLPLLCEDKNVPYIFVPSMAALGAACGTSRNVVACALVKKFNDNSLETEFSNLRIAIEKCYFSN